MLYAAEIGLGVLGVLMLLATLRICSLLEKTVYGGIVLEPFEERALDRFLYHLTGQDMKKSLGMWLKLHYACLKKRK